MLRRLIELSVHRRLATIVVTLGVGLFGAYAYVNTPIEAFPDVTNLQVNVITQMSGLAPPEIERQITIPLERALNGTPGMIQMRSESLFGLSLIYLTFEDGADSFRSRMLVAERLGTVDMPEGATPELAPDSTPLGQIFHFRVKSERHSLMAMRSEVEWTIGPMLRRVPGVADVVGRGGFLKEVQVAVDPSRLLAHGLTLQDVNDALASANRNVGGGFLSRGDQQLVIRGVGYFADARQVERVVLRSEGGTPLTIGDVARVVVSHTPRQGTVGYGPEADSVEGLVFMRRGENPSRVLDGIHDRIDELNRTVLPHGMTIVPLYDRSVLVHHTLETVHHSLLEGAFFVVLVVFLFLRSLRGSLVVGSVIPLSVLTAFGGLYLIGLPANLISMGAIDFGIIVDGAVILVENVIHELRHHRPTKRREILALVARAALDVARPTLFAMSIIIAALFPVFTLQRVEGRIFRPLALTYSFALLGALVFSLTAVPALAAFLMRAKDAEIREPKFVDFLRARYERIVRWTMSHRQLVFVALAGLMAIGIGAGSTLGSEFLPELDEGDLSVYVELPSSTSLEHGQRLFLEVRRRVLAFPEVRECDTKQGRPEDGTDNESVNMGATVIRLRPEEQWRPGMTKPKLIEELRRALADIPGISYNFSQPIQDSVEEAISGVRGKVVLKIFGADIQLMRGSLVKAMQAISHVRGVVDLGLYRDRSVPELEIRADREALARIGVTVDSVQDTIETALAGKVVTQLWEGERVVPIRVRLPLNDRDDIDSIGQILVRTPTGANVPLRDVAEIEVAPGRASINREDNSRALALKFNVEGRDMGSVVADAQAAVRKAVHLPDGYFFKWGGEFENQARAMKRLAVVVPISLLAVFALLFMSLGSGRGATTVMLSAPFCLVGGVVILALTGINLSVSAAIGFIALLGQVSLTALLVLGAIDELRAKGVPLVQACIDGATQRFRAVLMTALLAMLGLLPMAVSREVGSETQRPFATVIIGGLITTLFVVLVLLPAAYSMIAPKTFRTREEEDAQA